MAAPELRILLQPQEECRLQVCARRPGPESLSVPGPCGSVSALLDMPGGMRWWVGLEQPTHCLLLELLDTQIQGSWPDRVHGAFLSPLHHSCSYTPLLGACGKPCSQTLCGHVYARCPRVCSKPPPFSRSPSTTDSGLTKHRADSLESAPLLQGLFHLLLPPRARGHCPNRLGTSSVNPHPFTQCQDE